MRKLLASLIVSAIGLTALGVAAQPAAAAPEACAVTDSLVNPCRAWLGASAGKYPEVPTGLRAQIEAHEQRIGRPVDVVHSYHPPGSLPLSADELYFVNRPDTLLFVNWKPAARWADAGGGNAAVDAQIDRVADRIAAVAPHRIFLTLHHEPENDVSSGNCTKNARGAGAGSPADYRTMWRHVRDRFDARGATNVVWAIDYINFAPWDCLVPLLYPGNDLVDWVVFNGYGGPALPDYETNVGRFYDLLTRTSDADHDYLSKAWGIAEWNVRNASRTQAVAYYRQVKMALDAGVFPRLKAYLVFDNLGPEGNENRVAYTGDGVADQAKQDAYNAFANDPMLVGEGVDRGPPTAAITSPADDATVAGPVPVSADLADDTAAASARLDVDGRPAEARVALSGTTAMLVWDSASVPDGSHQLQVSVTDAFGNTGASPPVGVVVRNTPPPPPDVTAPSAPTSVTASAVGATVVDLTWQDATDDRAVTNYRVHRDGELIAVLPQVTSFRDDEVVEASTHRYVVSAVDAAGNVGDASPIATARTWDVTAPSVPTGVGAASRSYTTITIGWTPSRDNVGVSRYSVYRNEVLIGTSAVPRFTDARLVQGASYAYSVSAFDAAGNVSARSRPTVLSSLADDLAPTVPTGLRAAPTASHEVTLSWDASTDAGGSQVAGYRVYRGSTLIRTVAAGTLTCRDTLVEAGTTYRYRVAAVDGRGNASALSGDVSATMAGSRPR